MGDLNAFNLETIGDVADFINNKDNFSPKEQRVLGKTVEKIKESNPIAYEKMVSEIDVSDKVARTVFGDDYFDMKQSSEEVFMEQIQEYTKIIGNNSLENTTMLNDSINHDPDGKIYRTKGYLIRDQAQVFGGESSASKVKRKDFDEDIEKLFKSGKDIEKGLNEISSKFGIRLPVLTNEDILSIENYNKELNKEPSKVSKVADALTFPLQMIYGIGKTIGFNSEPGPSKRKKEINKLKRIAENITGDIETEEHYAEAERKKLMEDAVVSFGGNLSEEDANIVYNLLEGKDAKNDFKENFFNKKK